MTKTKLYGVHLIMDCYDANPKILEDLGKIFRFLDALPERIGMKKLGLPQLASVFDPINAGISGTIMITTSHISIHTYPRQCCFFLDIFSCNIFDSDALQRYIIEFFEVKSLESQEIVRGKRFPADI